MPSESPVPKPDEIIRNCVQSLSKDQQEYTAQLGESLAQLEAYENQLQAWQSELSTLAQELEQQTHDLEESRQQAAKQPAADLAMTAELDQARAEVEDLRRRLAETEDPMVAASAAAAPQESYASRGGPGQGGVELLDPTVSAVAKQFQKLRQQQASRRSASR